MWCLQRTAKVSRRAGPLPWAGPWAGPCAVWHQPPPRAPNFSFSISSFFCGYFSFTSFCRRSAFALRHFSHAAPHSTLETLPSGHRHTTGAAPVHT
eukprot:5811279-Prymnesium_polylepis.1